MSRPNLWFLPRAFFPHGGHGGGELPAFPAPSHFTEGPVIQDSGAICAARSRDAVWQCIAQWSFDQPRREGRRGDAGKMPDSDGPAGIPCRDSLQISRATELQP